LDKVDMEDEAFKKGYFFPLKKATNNTIGRLYMLYTIQKWT